MLGDISANGGDNAGDLVSRGQGVLLRAPVAANRVDVRVADARKLDVDVDIVGANFAAFDGGQGQLARGRGGSVSVSGRYVSPAFITGWDVSI